jgi:hypothetical protein
MRAGSPDPVLPLAPPMRDAVARADDVPAPKVEAEAQMKAAIERAKLIETEAPDIVVRLTEDGKAVTAKQELDSIRKAIDEGSDAELGRLDFDLVKVAAECAISLG